MLWVALHFPQLQRQALARGHASPEPGREALAVVAAWACRFTPRVSLEPPQAVLLEVEGSLSCFGGRWRFLAQLREGLTRLGFEARIAEAPTARAALWRARGNGGPLKVLPVAVLGLGPEALELLSNLGISTVGGLMRLPREGIVLRLGSRLMDEIDQATGSVPEAREFFVPAAQFSAQLALPEPVSQAEHALFVGRRLLEQMEGFLAARQMGARALVLSLLHNDAPATRIRIGLAAASRDSKHFVLLLREKLGALVLQAPVEGLQLEAEGLEALPQENGGLLPDPRGGGEEWQRFIERMQARLGSEAVHGIDIRADHRPERAWKAVSPGAPAAKGEMPALPRPLWLLDPPRRLVENDVALLAGPERIASGWWDGAEACRDYFVARVGGTSLAWIYRERGEGWFLHGYFA